MEPNGVGRPLKYSERTTQKSVNLPISFMDHLEEEAGKLGVSSSEFMYNGLLSMDKELVKGLTESFRELRDELRNNIKELSTQQGRFLKFQEKLNKKSLSFVLGEIEDDSELVKIVMENIGPFRNSFKKGGFAEPNIINSCYIKVEQVLLEKNKTIKKPAIIKAIIKKQLNQ